MSDNKNYEVYEVYCEQIDFNVLIMELPEEELEDKLAYFAKDKGLIAKAAYDDYLIAILVANVNQIMYRIGEENFKSLDHIKLREFIVGTILEKNEKLNYGNIVINKNQILKLRTDKDLVVGERFLVDNERWNYSVEDTYVDDVYTIEDVTELKSIDDLEFSIKDKWWKRIGRYVSIKTFNKTDLPSLLNDRFFHSGVSFNTFVVTLCVEDFEELFQLLENMGIPARVAPPLLMKELYDLCRVCNPFLTYENAQVFSDKSDKEPECTTCKSDNKNMSAGATTMDQYANKVDKKKKTFANVPEEDLLNLTTNMKVSLIGQDKAINSIVTAIQRASVGLKDPVKPIGSFLFAGSTGCGKTVTSKVLADELIKDRDNLITIDCSEYSADHEYSKLIGCFVPGTKVLKADGTVSNIEDISVGDMVVSHTGDKRKVNYLHEYDQNGKMIKFTTVNSNIPITTTKTHEIYCIKSKKCAYKHEKNTVCKPTCNRKDCSFKFYENYTPEWLPASELVKGDIVMYPRVKTKSDYPNKIDLVDYLEGTKRYKWDKEFVWAQKHIKVPRFIDVNEDFARLAGYYVSEGGGCKKTINFTFNTKELDYIIEVVKLIRKIFGKDVRVRIEDRKNENNTYRIYVSSKVVCNLMKSLFGKNVYVKHLPPWFNELPKKYLKGFLETAVFGDGCTVIPRRMDYSTVSPNLFYQMEQLFRKLGYITYKQLEKKATHNWSDRYRLYIGGNQITKLNSDFNFNIDLSGIKQSDIQRMSWMDADYQYLQIKKIDIIKYKGKVYDLAVDKDTSYVTEVAVHNSPPGYIAHDQGGVLTNAVLENPFSVIVFDEIEKASTKVYQLLLQVLEEGRLTDSKGTKVSFKDTIIIMTSNVGVDSIKNIGKTIGFGDVAVITEEKKEKAIESELKSKFKPEFLNRLNEIIYFNDLSKEDYLQIIDIELYRLNDNLQSNNTKYKSLELTFDKKIRDYVYDAGITKEFGARPLKRAIEKHISTPLAIKLLKGKVNPSSTVKVSTLKGEPIFKIKKKADDTPFYLDNKAEKIVELENKNA